MNRQNPFLLPIYAIAIVGSFLVAIALTIEPVAGLGVAIIAAGFAGRVAIYAMQWRRTRASPLAEGEEVMLKVRAAVGMDWCWLTVTNERVICEPHWASVTQGGTHGVSWQLRTYEILALERTHTRTLLLRTTDVLVIRTRQGERKVSGPNLDEIASTISTARGLPVVDHRQR